MADYVSVTALSAALFILSTLCSLSEVLLYLSCCSSLGFYSSSKCAAQEAAISQALSLTSLNTYENNEYL